MPGALEEGRAAEFLAIVDETREVIWRERAAATLILFAALAGLVLRARHLAHAPLWLDEAYSAFAADRGLGFIWTMVPRYESHPPVYYSLLHGWDRLAGTSLLARRLLGLLCGLGALATTGLAADRIGRTTRMPAAQRLAFTGIALLLFALQPLAVTMSREVRPYPVMMLVYAIGMVALLRLARDGAQRRAPDRLNLAIFGAAQGLICWLHTLGVLYAAAMTLALVCAVLRPGLTRRDWLWLVGGELLVGVCYLPALAIAIGEAKAWVGGTWLLFHPETLPTEIGTLYFDWNLLGRLVGFAAAIGGVALLARRHGGARSAGVLMSLAIVPVALSVLLSALVAPVFLDRTLSPVVPPMLLLAAAGLAWPGRRAWLALLPLLPLAGSMAMVDRQVLGQPVEDWYGAVDWLAQHHASGDTVWAYPNDGALPLDYALQDRRFAIAVRPIPAPAPALESPGFHPGGSPGAVSLYPRDIAALVASPQARAPGTIWLVRHAPALYDPDDRLLKALERDRAPVAHFASGRIDIVGLSARRGDPASPRRDQRSRRPNNRSRSALSLMKPAASRWS